MTFYFPIPVIPVSPVVVLPVNPIEIRPKAPTGLGKDRIAKYHCPVSTAIGPHIVCPTCQGGWRL